MATGRTGKRVTLGQAALFGLSQSRPGVLGPIVGIGWEYILVSGDAFGDVTWDPTVWAPVALAIDPLPTRCLN